MNSKNNIKISQPILSDLDYFLKEINKLKVKVKWQTWNKIAKKLEKNLKKYDPENDNESRFIISKVISNYFK